MPAGAATYVSIDVDVLDLSLVPGCVSAEPNGMTYAELRDTLKAIAEHTRVIGFDFVEVNPQLDVGTGITSYLGAHTVIEFLGHICDQPYWAEAPRRVPRPPRIGYLEWRSKHISRHGRTGRRPSSGQPRLKCYEERRGWP